MNGRVEDRHAIERQVYALGQLIDDADPDSWAAIFTQDGVTEAVMVGHSEPFSRQQGTDELRAFAQVIAQAIADGDRGPSLHHLTGLVFDELDAESATTRAMVLVTVQPDETSEPLVLTHGLYHDKWRNTAEGWRLAHRRYTAYGYRKPPAAALTDR